MACVIHSVIIVNAVGIDRMSSTGSLATNKNRTLVASCTAGKAQSIQDAGRDAHANWNVFPLILLACSVDTPIHINRSHLLAS